MDQIKSQISDCCKNTMDIHSAHNKMIVCDKCNEMIKLFTNEASYNNYIRYCKSKSRKTILGEYLGFRIVIISKQS